MVLDRPCAQMPRVNYLQFNDKYLTREKHGLMVNKRVLLLKVREKNCKDKIRITKILTKKFQAVH